MTLRSLPIALCLIAAGVSWRMIAQSAPGFTAAQSDAGRSAYSGNCASCHGDNLDDGRFAPPLRGFEFRTKWSGKALDELYGYMRDKMPPERPGVLDSKTYAAILSNVLEANGMQPGNQELAPDPEKLRALRMPKEALSNQQRLRASGIGVAANASLPAWPAGTNPLDKITAVTDAMLNNPPPGEWLTWRRTYDDLGFSPLKEINRNNVKNLRVAWSLTLPPGPNEATPLVHDGIIFVHSYGDNVQALNAVTGDELWHYSRRLPEGTRPGTKTEHCAVR